MQLFFPLFIFILPTTIYMNMKIRILLLGFFVFSWLNIFSQHVPNIKVTDIYGNYYNSTDILDEGKFIFIDFFTNNCVYCQYNSPFIDTAYRELGCNYGDVFFFAINANENSTDESAFEFATTFGLEMPVVSGEGGGGHIADILDVPYTPYFFLINTKSNIVLDTSMSLNSQGWIDFLGNYGLKDTVCCGNDFLFYQVSTETDTFYAKINTNKKKLLLSIPPNTELDSLESFFIASTKSTVFLDGVVQNPDSSIINLSDSLLTYRIIAENDSSSSWNLVIDIQTNTQKTDNNNKIYFNNSNNNLYISNYKEINYLNIYNIQGQLISHLKPTSNIQNFSSLKSGIYIISLNKKNGFIHSIKILKD